MVNKRGAISMEMIIVIILALITLVVVAAAFTGGMQKLMDKISGIGSSIPGSEFARTTCKTFCEANNTQAYCSQTFEGELKDETCLKLYTCPTITSC